MYSFKVENQNGEILNLSSSNKFDVLEVDGLYPPAATLTSTNYAGVNGSYLTKSRIASRPIILTIKIKPPVDVNRNLLYKFLTPGIQSKLYIKTALNDVYINGVVETMPITMFSQTTIATVTMICNDPYFYNVNKIVSDFRNNSKMFEFPFEVASDKIALAELTSGNTQNVYVTENVGFKLSIYAAETISKPCFENLTTGEKIKFSNAFSAGFTLNISTMFGDKYAEHLNLATGTIVNDLYSLSLDSNLFELKKGKNQLQFSANSGAESAIIRLTTVNKYLGV